jgi:predicted porin
MFKKTLVAASVLSALACSAAVAADVTLYGVIDTSLVFTAVDAKNGVGRTNKFEMSSGEEWGSRWGIRGVEDLGSGYSVGFDLQSGIRSDNGTAQYDRIFAREASIHVKGPFGKLTMGRMDALIGTRTSAGRMQVINAWGDGYGPYNPCIQNVMSEYGYLDNAVFYESPSLSGLTLRVQYSMGPDGVENKSNNTSTATANRYAAATAMYENGPLTLFLGADRVFYGHEAGEDADDSLTVTLGGKYDLGFMRLHAGVQYFDEVLTTTFRGFSWDDVPAKMKGFGSSVSAGIPLAGGNLMLGVSYLDAEAADSVKSDVDVKRIVGGVGYQFPLSKRTHLYCAASAGQDEVKTATTKIKPNYYKAIAGIRHLF